jgi:uncharacterized protein (DUF983 family)
MALKCPRCGGALAAFKVRNEFACPACGASLQAALGLPIVVTIVVWMAVSALVIFGWEWLLGMESALGFWSRSVIDVICGLIIYSVAVRTLAKVEENAAPNSGTA